MKLATIARELYEEFIKALPYPGETEITSKDR
jgi:hypothetical protein